MHKIEFQIGAGQVAINDIVARAEAAIASIERGEDPDPTTVIRFETWALFHKTMTSNRTSLVEYVFRNDGIPSIRALSRALGRDYHAVHRDVLAMIEIGLLGRDGNAITCEAEIQAARMVPV